MLNNHFKTAKRKLSWTFSILFVFYLKCFALTDHQDQWWSPYPDIPTLTHLVWLSRISLCNHSLTHLFENITQFQYFSLIFPNHSRNSFSLNTWLHISAKEHTYYVVHKLFQKVKIRNQFIIGTQERLFPAI